MTMIPRAMKDQLHKIFYARKILSNQPIYKDIMALIAPEHVDPRTWLYGREGEGTLVTAVEAIELLASGDYADHPHGPVIEINEDGGEVRNKEAWEAGEVVEAVADDEPEDSEKPTMFDIIKKAAFGEKPKDVVTIKDESGEIAGDPVILDALEMKNSRDEIVARAVGVGINPPDDANKRQILVLIDKKREEVKESLKGE